jgi:hypothetical protein
MKILLTTLLFFAFCGAFGQKKAVKAKKEINLEGGRWQSGMGRLSTDTVVNSPSATFVYGTNSFISQKGNVFDTTKAIICAVNEDTAKRKVLYFATKVIAFIITTAVNQFFFDSKWMPLNNDLVLFSKTYNW